MPMEYPQAAASTAASRPHPIQPERMHNVLLLGLVGHDGAGKTTAADYLTQAHSFEPFSLAAPRQSMLEALFVDVGIDYAHIFDADKQPTPLPELMGLSARKLLQGLDAWGEALQPGIWRYAAAACLGFPHAPVHDRIVISDIQRPADAAWITAHGGLLVRVLRPSLGQPPSLTELDLIQTQHSVINDGPLEVLFAQLDELMLTLGAAQAKRVA